MEVDYEPAGPKPIKRLSKDVINQIAAAEIIHRPANAIKELIENSLDAGSTSIKLTLKDGGLKLIQIADNGHGIGKSDLPLLCTRYATSKLARFEDLQSLATYGFRGEALASISYVSHVEVITKTREEGCGYKAHYMDGELVAAKPGTGVDPKPAAANDGTVISAEDLFYNMPLRKRAFKSASDEYNRVLDVITKYAIHNPHSAWTCKKAGTAMADITTPPASTSKANIALLYGSALANDLLEIRPMTLQPEDKLGAKLKGWVSSANQSWARKGGWIIFINNRLVDSNKIKKAVDSLYTAYLPKGSSPWCYLSLEIDPTKVDVNVSPTKSEVHFLNEDEMIEAIVGAVQTVLAGANTSRSFTVQTVLPGATEKRNEPTPSSSTRKPAPNYKVRMDPSNRTLDSMISVPHPSQVGDFVESQSQFAPNDVRPAKRRGIADEPIEMDDDGEITDQGEDDGEAERPNTTGAGSTWTKRMVEVPESECDFTSIIELRSEAAKRGNTEVKELMLKHAFVGIVDLSLGLSLVQHSTRLFLANHASLGEEHFYQLGLRQFGAFNRLKLDPPPLLRDLVQLAAEDESGIKANGLDINHIVETITNVILDKREMLDEYFSLTLSDEGEIESLPLLLKGYTPDLDRLPHFLLCLGTRVDWISEKQCFETFLRELAHFYAPHPSLNLGVNRDEEGEEGEEKHGRWQIEHVLWPSMRRYTSWSKDSLTNGDLKQVANLPDLFRIFERC